MIERIAAALGYERRSFTAYALTSMANAVADGERVVGALEAAAGIIGRALASATVTGAGASNFDAETVQAIGRALIIRGEYAGLITPGATLTQLFDFEIVPGPLGPTGPGSMIRYDGADGQSVTTDRAILVRYSMREDGRGAGVLQNARRLYEVAYHLERIWSEELSGMVGSVMPLPRMATADLSALQSTLRDLKGKTTFVETTMQGRAPGVPQPKADYEQIKIAPLLQPEWIAACEATDRTIYRAVGIPLSLISESLQPTRESLRQFWTMTIEPLAKLIEDAAGRKGIEVGFDFGQAARYDVAGRARAFGILTAAGFDDELAAEYTGFPLE